MKVFLLATFLLADQTPHTISVTRRNYSSIGIYLSTLPQLSAHPLGTFVFKECGVIMKLYIFIVIICLVFSLPGCSKPSATENKTPSPVDYNLYTQYSYGGPRAQSDTTFYYCTTSKNAFDSLFFFIYDHNNIPDTIPSADFLTKKVISIVKYGNDIHALSVKGVNILDGILDVEYSDSLVTENKTWIAAIPLIITTSAGFQKIIFIENGKQLKEINP
ncbi:MAG: hypothetical protein ABSC53_09735 [Bacteroidota bacterium]|jgi:hypothetical protein